MAADSTTPSAKPPHATPWPLRPFVYAWHFATGTVGGGLDGLATGGRLGAMWGAVAGIAAAFFPAAAVGVFSGHIIFGLMAGFVGGLVGGAAVGGVVSTLTSGAKTVMDDSTHDHALDAKEHAGHVAADKAQAQAAKAERRAKAIGEHEKHHKAGHFQDLLKGERDRPRHHDR